MSQVKSIFQNFSWLMISQLISSVCGFIWTILIARYLGVNEYGILGFATSIVAMMGVLLDLGITTYTIRQLATKKEDTAKYLGNIYPLKSLLAIGTFLFLLIILIVMKCDELTIIITLLFMIESIIQTMMHSTNGAFQAHEKSKYQGIESILLNILLLIFIIFAIFTNFGIFGIVASYIGANVIGLIYAYYALRKNISKPKFEFDRTFCKTLILLSLPFALSGIFNTIYYSIDIVMLNNFVGDYATGLYNATYKLISVLALFYTMYTVVIYPVMSKFYKNDKRLLAIIYEKSIKYLMLVMIPLAIATMIYSSDVIQLIYGNEYGAASSALSILIWTVCLLFVNGAGNILLNASHKEVTITKIYAIAALFNVVLNLFMIPYLSYIGAAITTVLSDLLIFVVQKYIIHKIGQKPNKRLYLDIGKIVLGSLVLGVVLFVLNLNMWVAIPFGIILYLVTVIVLKLFDDDDKYVIKEILNRN